MIFSQDRQQLRKMYADAWAKRCAGEVLSPLEAQIADVVADHPEYHKALAEQQIDRDFLPEDGQTNPFLHMGLHLGVREQCATNRPAGIRAVFESLVKKTGNPHDAEHAMLECLAETLWEAQSQNAPPDEGRYLQRAKALLR